MERKEVSAKMKASRIMLNVFSVAPSNFLKIKSRASSGMLLNSRRLSMLDFSNVGPSNTNNASVTPVASSSQLSMPVSATPVEALSTEPVDVKPIDDEFYPYKAEALFSCKLTFLSSGGRY